MIKVYALNKNGKIELTLEELQKLIDEAENEGKRLAGQPSIVYRECPYKMPQTAKTVWGDTPPYTSPFTCETRTATGTVSKAEETDREKFDREFNEGVVSGELQYLKAKGR